jgi:hypothetical protein
MLIYGKFCLFSGSNQDAFIFLFSQTKDSTPARDEIPLGALEITSNISPQSVGGLVDALLTAKGCKKTRGGWMTENKLQFTINVFAKSASLSLIVGE